MRRSPRLHRSSRPSTSLSRTSLSRTSSSRTSRSLTSILALAVCLVAGPAWSTPMNYALLFDGSAAATFTLDPDDATSPGLSDVDFTAFELSVNVSGYGLVEFDLGDITASPPRGLFLDGEFASMTTVGATGTLPDGSTFILDLTPFVPASAAMIDLSMAGEYNLTLIDTMGGFPDEIGSFGIALQDDTPDSSVPEPTAALVFAAGMGVTGFACRRERRRLRRRS